MEFFLLVLLILVVVLPKPRPLTLQDMQEIAAIDLEMKANAASASRPKNYRDNYFYEQPKFLGENQ